MLNLEQGECYYSFSHPPLFSTIHFQHSLQLAPIIFLQIIKLVNTLQKPYTPNQCSNYRVRGSCPLSPTTYLVIPGTITALLV